MGEKTKKTFKYNYRLEDLKDENNLKGKDVAKKLGVSESVYSEFENMKLSIPTKRLVELANIYKVNIDYMLHLTDERLNIKTTNKINIKETGLRAKRIRKEKKMTIKQLADKANASISTISEYENGKYLISGSLLVELAKITNCSIDWILGRSEQKYLK